MMVSGIILRNKYTQSVWILLDYREKNVKIGSTNQPATYINQLFSEKQGAYSSLLNRGHQNKMTEKTYKEIKGTFQRQLRRMKSKWSSKIFKEVQKASDLKDVKTICSLLN